MLGKYVSRGGSRVLDLDIHEGRNLYYYPNDVKEVVAITDQKNYEVVKNQGIKIIHGFNTTVSIRRDNVCSYDLIFGFFYPLEFQKNACIATTISCFIF
jgi:xylose isomerase